jgi:5-methyltetrahydrofolate--homocysteine methyltransferase
MPNLLEALSDRVLLCDGGTGSRVQSMDLEVERDYWGQENCTDVLNLSRPDIVRELHRGYFQAGADMVETNTFGASPITLGEFDGLADKAFEINKVAGELAREVIEEFAGDGRERFVVGSVGPGTKLPSLGHAAYDRIEAALALQCEGLVAGGVDGILIETCQDTLQIKAAVNGAKIARAKAGREVPIFVQVTVETTGTLLVGPDISAAATVIDSLDVPMIGLNCATGPQEMSEHVRWLKENWTGFISCQPNAGLPELVAGQTRYPLSPDEMTIWMERFIEEDGLNLIGGCCGTNIQHIQALDAMLRRRGGDKHRPAPVRRNPIWIPASASLYTQVPLRQENAYFSIGERCNANGSKRWRQLQETGDWDGCVEMGREQVGEGSNALDVCTAFVGRDEISEMNEVVRRLTGAVTAPLVIDSTETPVIEAALKLYGGKAIINSINFEDGEKAAADRLVLAKKFGCSVIALTIDEEGMAKTPERKLEIARRLVDFACGKYGLPQSDLLIDPLTFTIATGNEDDRKLGEWTLEGISLIRQEFPDVQIILGLSNISFGLNPAARHVLNSVFLDQAVKAGMTGAIVHVSKIKPLHLIPDSEVKVVDDLIHDRREGNYDPLQELLALFSDRKAEDSAKRVRAETAEERLVQRIVDGDRKGLDVDLDDAMTRNTPLEIINTFLLDGMKTVGELFGAGKMQLPFVLQSAETMKAAVAHLEPHMEKVEGQERGTMILATVKGDVHDIGKNLVDIILTNNGYRVINLGIKQPIQAIVDAAREYKADAIGMSGLLVKSTVVMRENLEEMSRQDVSVPVILGGAALTRNYVEEDCTESYKGGRVAYARDAFDGLTLMDKVMTGSFDEYLAAIQVSRAGRPSNRGKRRDDVGQDQMHFLTPEEARHRRTRLTHDVPVPNPPFWGAKIVEHVPVKTLVPFINERSLFQFQWGFRKAGRSLEEFLGWARQELRPVLKRMLDLTAKEDILHPQAAYGYWKAAAEGNDLIVFDEDGTTELTRFTLPRQPKADGECIADFFQDVDSGLRDVVAFQAVTVGAKASDIAHEWFEANRYQDYLYLHGLSVETAEAMAEYIHKRIRAEWGFATEESRDMEQLLSQGYHGSRYSFGYPACPNLEDQEKIFALLGADRIGMSLSDEWQIHPEQSTSALVVHHPKAKYFTV